MSRIGKKPIDIPAGVTVEQKGLVFKAKGPNGESQVDCNPVVKVVVAGSVISVLNETPEDKFANKMHGTMRALIANVITGVSKGFTRKMEIFGTGYNLKEQGNKLVFQVGFCHPVEMVMPKGIKVKIDVPATRGNEVPAKFTLLGVSKDVLGQFAADIRKIRPPEPYKGKGIRYADEHVRRKVGKAFASGAA
ncbi:MAG: 50S ribosomal protein L6 [Planctomycetes bacterium]|nr:50S ribosomal protein L6 [Planctomycetota bacterium]